MKNLLLLFIAVLALSLSTGCSKDDPATLSGCDATLFNQDINPKLSSWQDAATAYANDQSVANCNTYKSTGQAFLESIRSYENCASLYTQSWRDAVDEAQADLAAIPC
jgi:hypothetical protein